MSIISVVVCMSLLSGLPVEVTRLDGNRLSGELQGLSDTALKIEGTNGAIEIAVTDLQQIQLTAAGGAVAPLQVRLTDESLLGGEKVAVAAGKLTLDSVELGSITLPTEMVHSVLLATVDTAQLTVWEEMRKKVSQSDLLIVRKGENLDFVGGTIGSVDAEAVTLISRGREVKVPRERIVGVVYATHKLVPGSPACEVSTLNGSRLRVKGVDVQAGLARLDLIVGPQLEFPMEALQSLDFGLGRIVPLMKAVTRQTLPPGVSEATVAVRDHAYSSSTLKKIPLKVGGKSYSGGLLIHPQTKLEFTLNRQYRKLRTIVGIDENATERARFEPVVQVQILADGQLLWEQAVRWDAAPVSLDLDVADVRTLEIITTATDGKVGPLRHLVFADAKLIK